MFNFEATCVDTPGWADLDGNDCEIYASYICVNGIAHPETEGSDFNYPERNCCACGKGKYGTSNIYYDFLLRKSPNLILILGLIVYYF